jgi:hypothetical protein
MTRLRLAVLLLVGAFMPATLSGQQDSAGQRGPRIERSAAAMRVAPAATHAEVAMQARGNNVGKPVALMVVGGAAIILGSVVGDDVGTLFAIGGAVALLYGLYLYLR